MTTSTFIRRKNNILREYLGLNFDLVPPEQIVDIPATKRLYIDNVARSCPYCVEFEGDCDLCPMAIAKNQCEYGATSTWSMYILSIPFHNRHTRTNSPAYEPMVDLIEEYNKQFEEI
jgi:hypothetical protein